MPNIQRILYSDTNATIGATYVGPCTSASIDYNVPLKSSPAFGFFLPTTQQQTDYITFKADFKILLAKTDTALAGALNTAVENTANGTPTQIAISNSFSAWAILSNVSIDASVGEFITCNLSWAGIGKPEPNATVQRNVNAVELSTAATMTTSSDVVKSAKFSFDIPNEVIKVLGQNPLESNANLKTSQNAKIISKPPYKATLSFDGPFVTVGAASLTFGPLKVEILGGRKVSQKFDQKAGDVAANTSVSFEGSRVKFT